MTEFKIGDKVKRVSGGNNGHVTVGDIVTITSTTVQPASGMWIATNVDDDPHKYHIHKAENFELIKPTIEVGKTYKNWKLQSKHTILFVNNKGVLTQRDEGQTYFYEFDSYPIHNWKEIVPERYIAVTYKTSLKDSVETSSKFYATEAEVRAEYGNRPLFAGVVKLENA